MSIQSPQAVIADQSVVTADAFLTDLLDQCCGLNVQILEPEMITWVQEVRNCAATTVRQSILPTTRNEEWRFTDLSRLRQIQFQAVSSDATAMDVESLVIEEAARSRLVFVDGVYAPTLSNLTGMPDKVVLSNLAGLPITHRLRVQNYLAQIEGANEVFTALNTAGIADVAILWVPKNVVVESPVHLLFIATATEVPTFSQPRCLVVAEPSSKVTLIEDYLNYPNIDSPEEGEAEVDDPVYFTNAVTEIWIEENAEVNHTRIERDSPAAFHIGKSAIAQARDSRYTCNAITLGAKLSRHNLEVFQTGEQTATNLNGLTLITGEQLADTHSLIALNYPYGTSNQLHKCIVADRAHAVFNGKILVPQAAQLTDAAQLNRNLLLSPRARVDTKPQLEITADNVKCAHGATVSQLDDEEVFYLQSRGLDAIAARRLLINAFATEIINQLPVVSLQKVLSQAVSRQHLAQG